MGHLQGDDNAPAVKRQGWSKRETIDEKTMILNLLNKILPVINDI
jgi:hypothetical protein